MSKPTELGRARETVATNYLVVVTDGNWEVQHADWCEGIADWAKKIDERTAVANLLGQYVNGVNVNETIRSSGGRARLEDRQSVIDEVVRQMIVGETHQRR